MAGSTESFRVRGIPLAYDESKTAELVKRALGLNANAKMDIGSLAPEPYPSDTQVATVNFDTRPERLSTGANSAREWNISDGAVRMMVDSHFEGITALHWPKEENWKMDVIALPGLGGHAFESFKAEKTQQMWLRDFLPEKLPEARVLTYGYDSRFAGNTSQNIKNHAHGFLHALESIRASSGTSSKRKPIVFIGHDLGGIILKQAILDMLSDASQAPEKEVLESITAILFFGVPHLGMNIRPLLPIVQDPPNEDLARSLEYNSEMLINQSKHFAQSFQGKKWGIDLDRVKTFFYYETKTSPTAVKVDGTWKMDGPRALLLERSSATDGHTEEDPSDMPTHFVKLSGKGNQFVKPIDTPHSKMVKFADSGDAYYLAIFTTLKDLVMHR